MFGLKISFAPFARTGLQEIVGRESVGLAVYSFQKPYADLIFCCKIIAFMLSFHKSKLQLKLLA